MGFWVEWRDRLEVTREGHDCGNAPTQATSVLLIGLLARDEAWSDRVELAAKLYPGQARTQAQIAFRQTLLRLRRWLGEGALQVDAQRVRVTPGAFSLAAPIEGPDQHRLAPGIVHPWLDELRDSHRSPVEAGEGQRKWLDAVFALAELDPDSARSAFLSVPGLVTVSPLRAVEKVFGLTKPKDRRDPFAGEYLLAKAWHHARLMSFATAIGYAQRSYALAVRERRREPQAVRATVVSFLLQESGDLEGAAEWRPLLLPAERSSLSRLSVLNADACFLWNSGEVEEAAATMHRARRLVEHAGRGQRAHFLSNFSFFAAEWGQLELAEDLQAEASSLIVEELEPLYRFNVMQSQAVVALHRRCLDEAESILRDVIAASDQLQHPLARSYPREILAEVLSQRGRTREAYQIWREVEAQRAAGGGKLTKRLQRLRQSIFSRG